MAEDQRPGTEGYKIATADSKDCEFCHGQGVATVYASGYNRSPLLRDHDGRPYVARTMAHCHCPLGRFLRMASKEDVRRATPEVANILDGYSTWSLDDPTEEALDDPSRPVTKKDFTSLRRKIESQKMLKLSDDAALPRQSAWSIQTALRKRLARELGLDEQIADVLTIDELQQIKELSEH
jgi:hypothetical protein